PSVGECAPLPPLCIMTNTVPASVGCTRTHCESPISPGGVMRSHFGDDDGITLGHGSTTGAGRAAAPAPPALGAPAPATSALPLLASGAAWVPQLSVSTQRASFFMGRALSGQRGPLRRLPSR